MKRRNFITSALLAGGALALPNIGCTKQPSNSQALTTNADGFVTEPARQIPILASTDVVVVGGGPAGVAAAIAASRGGAETYLIERYNHLGGLWTGGLVLPLLSTHGKSPSGSQIQVIQGIGGEMAKRLADLGMSIHEVNPVIDPEAGKYVLDEMISDAGVKVIYHSVATQAIMDGHEIKGIFIENKSGRQAILAKVVIDCSGDGDVINWTGDSFDEIKYHIGLVHRLGNTDRVNTKAPGYEKLPLGEPTPIKGVTWYNMYGEDDQSGTDILNLSRLQQKYRKEIWENWQKIHSTPGYEEVFLLDTAPQLGVRASRILDGEYKLTMNDSMTYHEFDDAIGVSGAWISVLYQGKRIQKGERPYWQIPYRALLPKKTDGLIVAGRCFSYEKSLIEDARVIGTCLITGHGAGAAASIAVKSNNRPRDIDKAELRNLLIKQNVWLG